MKATDKSKITSDAGGVAFAGAGGAGGGVGVGVGISAAFNRIGDVTVRGVFRQHTITAKVVGSALGTVARPAGAVSVEAKSEAVIKALTIVGAAAGAGGAGGGVALSGAGNWAENSIDATVEAAIVGSTVRTAAGSGVSVTATDLSKITSHAVAGVARPVRRRGRRGVGAGPLDRRNSIGRHESDRRLPRRSSPARRRGRQATATPEIASVSVGVAAALSGGVFASMSLAGADLDRGRHHESSSRRASPGQRRLERGGFAIAV